MSYSSSSPGTYGGMMVSVVAMLCKKFVAVYLRRNVSNVLRPFASKFIECHILLQKIDNVDIGIELNNHFTSKCISENIYQLLYASL